MIDRETALHRALEGVDPVSSRMARYRAYADADLLPVTFPEDDKAYSFELLRRFSETPRTDEACDDPA
jgi:hypothetical protein